MKGNILEQYKNQTFVYFDIETIPTQDPNAFIKARKDVTAPARYKKPDSIADWIAENGDEEAQKVVDKTSFDGGLGHVCTIAWTFNDDPVRCNHAKTLDEERGIIKAFFDAFDLMHSQTLVGHYIHGFDIPFLKKRAICIGVEMPPNNVFPRDPKAWDKSIHDTMTMWAGGRDTISMDNLCEILGIEGKGDFDGTMVAEAWKNGEHEKIAEYCKDDVRRTREIHQRMLKAGW